MTPALKTIIAKLSSLPEDEQNAIAAFLKADISLRIFKHQANGTTKKLTNRTGVKKLK